MTIRNCNQGLDGRSVSAHAGGCTILRAMLAERIVKRGGCLALLFVLAVGPLTSAANKPNIIILVTLDSVRADRMGFLGVKSRTPNLDALAKQSVIFERAYAQAPLTVVSHATILSGTYPQVHRASELGNSLASGVPYLPEVLHGHGYRCGAFVGSILLDPRNGFVTEIRFKGVKTSGGVDAQTKLRQVANEIHSKSRWVSSKTVSIDIYLGQISG